ncbi:putative transcriptional regulatory protein [Pseudocercospora fuligena]|uniref:Putative transcriptional regulatory protein n=1 Tax=Pseudocercospora fuligena TaxID=685502 RepID=A0A8H6R5A0_9PEZI|nr:putative transcriptional regulatory protein [Pseudocercospora fuligena]
MRAASLLVLRDAASDSQGFESAVSSHRQTIIEKGYLSASVVRQLLDLFRAHYRRWVALRENRDTEADLDFTGSPLLLCACCLIAVRHWDSLKAGETAAILFTEAKKLLQVQLLEAPQGLAFFQAVLILSLWSTTIGQKPLSIDSWLTSGFAIQHGKASDVFKDAEYSSSLESEYTSTVGKLLLWSRLCLAHLHACVSMRRKAVFGAREIDRIKKTLPPGELSNFEMRMVAELSLYWDLYENAVAAPVALPQAQAALQSWKLVWQFLFDQPRSQFLQMGFHFAQLLIFEQSLNNKSAAVRESLISEMVRLSSAILQLAMDTADERTKHLTDHIYHMISFAAVTLCRLLCKYEEQMQATQYTADHDLLIMNTASWLRTLGTQLHVGQTMGNVIDAVHRKLRPSAHNRRRDSEPENATPDTLTFPELLGVDTLDLDWDAILPDWQSLASDEIPHSAHPA